VVYGFKDFALSFAEETILDLCEYQLYSAGIFDDEEPPKVGENPRVRVSTVRRAQVGTRIGRHLVKEPPKVDKGAFVKLCEMFWHHPSTPHLDGDEKKNKKQTEQHEAIAECKSGGCFKWTGRWDSSGDYSHLMLGEISVCLKPLKLIG